MRKFTAVFAYLGFLLLPSLALGQATITGVVRTRPAAVLPGVTVEATSHALIEKVRIAVTDGTGQFRIIDLRPGTYTVTFTLAGFQHRQARRRRADGIHGHRQRRHEGRRARRDDHRHRRDPDRGRAERPSSPERSNGDVITAHPVGARLRRDHRSSFHRSPCRPASRPARAMCR